MQSGDLDTELMVCYRVMSPEPESEAKREGFFEKQELYPDTMIDTKKEAHCFFALCSFQVGQRGISFCSMTTRAPMISFSEIG